MNFEIPRIRELFRIAKLILHREGTLSLFKALFKQLSFTYKPYVLYKNTLDGPIIPCKVDNLTLKSISDPRELDKLVDENFTFSSYHMNIQECKERLSRGALLFCAFVGKELAHGSWVATSRRAYYDFHPFPMDCERTGYVGGTMTIPKYQRKGINLYAHSEIFQYLKESGLSKAVIAIEKNNIAAQNSQDKLCSKVWRRGYYLRLFIFELTWLSSNSLATKLREELH